MLVSVALVFLGILFILSVLKNPNAIGLFFFIELFFPSEIGVFTKSLNVCELGFVIFFIYVLRANWGSKKGEYPRSLLLVPVLFIVVMVIPYYNSVGIETQPFVQLLVYDFPKFFFPGILLFFSIKTFPDFTALIRWVILLVFCWVFLNAYEFSSKGNFFIDQVVKEFPKEAKSINAGYEYNGHQNGGSERFGSSIRVQATVFHPISYGGRVALLMCLLLLSASLVNYNSVLKKSVSNILLLLIKAAIVLTLIGALLTFTRSVWVFSVLAFGVYFYCYTKYKKGILIVAGSALLFLLIYGSLFIAKYNNVKGSSIEMRVDQYNAVMHLLRDNYILGQGNNYVNNYLDKYGLFTAALGFESFFFVVILDYGLVGVLFYFVFFRNIFISTYKSGLKPLVYFSFYITFPYLIFILITGELETLWIYWMVVNIGAACVPIVENYSNVVKVSGARLANS